jgi:ABC-type Zn2+ transport system substrate-binding protein/surface adhesin
MSFWSALGNGLLAGAQRLAERAEEANAKQEQPIGGKTTEQWESEWKELPEGLASDVSGLSKKVGLYRARKDGETKYIGRAAEHDNGGLQKRLKDYTRESDSSRKHGSGQLMNEHRHNSKIDVLVTGSDKEAAQVAKDLEKRLIQKHKPEWNDKLK